MALLSPFRYHSAFNISSGHIMFPRSTSLRLSTQSKLLTAAMIALLLVTLPGCKKDKNKVDNRAAAEMYEDAKRYMNGKTGRGLLARISNCRHATPSGVIQSRPSLSWPMHITKVAGLKQPCRLLTDLSEPTPVTQMSIMHITCAA